MMGDRCKERGEWGVQMGRGDGVGGGMNTRVVEKRFEVWVVV